MVKVKNMKAVEFEKKLSTEKVVCFCAGQGLRELCDVYPMITNRISYVVDNYCYGKKIAMNSSEVQVISMKEITEDIEEALLIITSIQYADEIIKQLDEIKQCDDLEVFVPALFQGNDSTMELKNDGKKIIPKIIHYCWFGKGDIPERFQKNIESWKRMCPDYEIIRWDESNYDYKKNNYMRQAYEAGKWGFVPDYARLDIVNAYGGIYLDVDVELIKPLKDFLQFRLFCGFEDVWSVNFGLGFGGIAENPILCEMMDLYSEIDFIKPDGTLNLIASPMYQTKVLEKHGLLRNGCCQVHDGFAAFSAEFFSPLDAYGYGKVTENTYSIHQYAATWFEDRQKSVKERKAESVRFIMERMR